MKYPKSEYDEKSKVSLLLTAGQALDHASRKQIEEHLKADDRSSKTFWKSLKLARGGGIAIKGTNFKGVF
jgi:hypothetical protein